MWTVFYRPPPPSPSSPRFKLPLSRAILDDPAFSPDPRSHPHYPLANALNYKDLPPKYTPVSSSPKVLTKPPPPPPVPPKVNSLARDPSTPLPLQNSNTPRRARMKALVRRLTIRHKLDRIDELDETDPFGGGYHHHGPYEAISSNLTQSTPPRRYSDPPPRRGNIHHLDREDPRLHPSQHRSAPQVPSAHDGTGLSLHLEPGQILQRNIIYSSHVSSIPPAPSQITHQPNPVAIVTRPDHSRSQSVPNVCTRSPQDSSPLDLPDSFPNRPPLSSATPRERYLGDNKPDISNSIPLHHDRDVAPYVHNQIETTFLPPPRYESRLHNLGPVQPPQRTSSPSSDPPPRKARSAEGLVPALPPLARKSMHSVDSSYAPSTTLTHTSSSVRHQSLEPPRIRHLPKRLVMPAPLQPQPQPQHTFPLAEPVAWQDDYPDAHALEGAYFPGKPAMYTHEPRLLRKRSSAFPAKTPIPDHAPISQNDPVPIMASSPMKTTNETEGTKEWTRRRRLSKRKNDI